MRPGIASVATTTFVALFLRRHSTKGEPALQKGFAYSFDAGPSPVERVLDDVRLWDVCPAISGTKAAPRETRSRVLQVSADV